MRHTIVELSGVQKSLLDRDYYFSDLERYKANDLMVYWSFLGEIGFLAEGTLPLSYIRLHSHATSKSYHSLCFENMTVDTLEDIYDNKQKGYSLLDSLKPMHFVNDFYITRSNK